MRINLLPLLLALVAVPGSAFAHHGWSSYDETKPLTVTAPVTDVTWGNPHGTAKVKWRGKAWDVVLAPTTRMEARGLRQADLVQAKNVTLTGYARRDGTAEMRIERVTIGDKTVELR